MYYLKREIHSQYEWCLLTPHLVADKQVSIGFWNTSMCFLSMIFPGRRMEFQSCYYIVLWMLILYIFVTLILAFCSKTLCVWKLNLASFCLVRCNAIKGVFIMCKCIKCGYEIIPLILEQQEMLYLNITQLCRPLYLEYDSRCALYKGNIWSGSHLRHCVSLCFGTAVAGLRPKLGKINNIIRAIVFIEQRTTNPSL